MALMLSVSAFAMKVGYVNSQEAFAKFSQTKTVQENLNKEKTRLENEIKQKPSGPLPRMDSGSCYTTDQHSHPESV